MVEGESGVSEEDERDRGPLGLGGNVGEGGVALPQCYSSAQANPSQGAWRKSANGVVDSPTDMFTWPHPGEHGFLMKCSRRWNTEHAGEGPMPYYVWEPEQCLLDTVDAAKFCSVMEGRKGLLLVGDSLSRLMMTTLASIVRAEAVVADSAMRTHDEWLACGGALKMQFQRNDYLDTRTVRPYENHTQGFEGKHCEIPDPSTTRCTVFADSNTLVKFDTLVINSGAHQRPPERYGPAMELAMDRLTESMRRLHGDSAILVVRNTAPGHSECDERMYEGPVRRSLADRLVAKAPKLFKYSTFKENNRLLERAFISNDSASGWILLDAYTPTLLRADMHLGGNDCLHYCVPGPTDHWIRLLYNILLAAKARPQEQP